MVEPVSKTAAALPLPRARLILQDPSAFDQATQPALRLSVELTNEPTAFMAREKARELWESLNLEPEAAQQKLAERQRLLARAQALEKETAAAKAQALELQARLAQERNQRFQHPVVYVGAAALLGLGALWWLERRKRIQLQERELTMLAEQTPSLLDDAASLRRGQVVNSQMDDSIEDLPDLASDFATDLSGLPDQAEVAAVFEKEDKPALSPQHSPFVQPETLWPEWAHPAKHSEKSLEPSAAQQVLLQDKTNNNSAQSEERSLLNMSKQVLQNIIKRKRRDAQDSSQYSTQNLSTQTRPTLQQVESTQMSFDEELQLALDQELIEQNLESIHGHGYDPDQANIDLLSQTRVAAQSGESAVEHLLELRTAVMGLSVLGRPSGAARLLEEHIAADPHACAWAYLEYMHLCEQLQLRDDFETMRKKYRQHFNRMAPYWHEPNSNVLGLDGYARAANELCAAWSQGVEVARQTLATWLMGPMLARKLVQLPAFHDLFDLYEMLELIELNQAQIPEVMSSNSVKSISQTAAVLGLLKPPIGNSAFDMGAEMSGKDADQEFVPTVSLLDLDYEFSSDVTLEEREVQASEKAITVVKTGNFSVDFNVTGTQLGVLPSLPAELGKK